MKINNPLSREFLLQYPNEAARTLEQVASQHVGAFLVDSSSEARISVLSAMLPDKAAQCLSLLDTSTASKFLLELSVPCAARIYRLLAVSIQKEIYQLLPDKKQTEFNRYLNYPPDSAGALIDTKINVLPQKLKVADAIHYVEKISHPVHSELYIVNESYKLVGQIGIGSLLASNHNAQLKDIMSRKIKSVPVHAAADSLLIHPGWEKYRRLPIVERDNTLVGVLDYATLRGSVGELDTSLQQDPFENMLSIVGMYWLSMTQLLNSVISIAERGKGD